MLEAAVIGCGRVSRFHTDAYNSLNGVKLVAGVEINSERGLKFHERYGIPVYKSIEDLLSSKKIDLVSVCTPSDLHFEMVAKLMSKKINVIVEKPVCLSEKQGEALLALEKDSEVVATTCFQNRFNPPVEWLIKIVKEGRLGKIYLGAVCVRWYRGKKYFDDWHGSKLRSGGGALMTQAIHHIDLLRLLMGNPKKISGFYGNMRGYGETEELLISSMVYDSGGMATLETSVLSYPKDVETSVTLIGEKGTVKVGGKSLNRIEYGLIEGVEVPDEINADDPVSVYGTSHILLIRDVVSAISDGRKPRVSLKEGVETVRLVNRIYSSLK